MPPQSDALRPTGHPSRRSRWLICALVCLATIVRPGPLQAASSGPTRATVDQAAGGPPPPRPALLFDLPFWPHAVATAGMFTLTALMQEVVARGLRPQLGCDHQPGAGICSRHGLFALDAAALRPPSAGWRHVSDVLELLSVAAPVGAALLEHGLLNRPGQWLAARQDILVGLESVAVASIVSTTLKFAVRRPRPMAYRMALGPGAVERGDAAQELSFPSGHVSAAAAGMTAYAATFAMRHPAGRALPWVVGAAVAVTGLTAVGRVLGGMHFPTDVIGGCLVGATTGLLVPWLARHRLEVRPAFGDGALGGENAYRGLAVSWSP